ncbi:MAG: response regulator [Gammaproteobacteria bacterium]
MTSGQLHIVECILFDHYRYSRMSKESILIVDDDRTTASVMQLHLDNFGYHVAGIASSAKEAINIARDLKPDLVLMDIRLGEGADGIDAALAISKHMNIPIVFVTAHSDSKTLRRAKIVNPAGFINKPLRESDLKTTIEFALNQHPKIVEKSLEGASIGIILEKTYKLTPAEARVVNMLLKYPELNSTANALNICLSTVRTHLKHIYRKTNTNSKLMLLREIASGPAAKLINKQLNENTNFKNWTDLTGS